MKSEDTGTWLGQEGRLEEGDGPRFLEHGGRHGGAGAGWGRRRRGEGELFCDPSCGSLLDLSLSLSGPLV